MPDQDWTAEARGPGLVPWWSAIVKYRGTPIKTCRHKHRDQFTALRCARRMAKDARTHNQTTVDTL